VYNWQLNSELGPDPPRRIKARVRQRLIGSPNRLHYLLWSRIDGSAVKWRLWSILYIKLNLLRLSFSAKQRSYLQSSVNAGGDSRRTNKLAIDNHSLVARSGAEVSFHSRLAPVVRGLEALAMLHPPKHGKVHLEDRRGG